MSHRAISTPLMAWMTAPCRPKKIDAFVHAMNEPIDLERILAEDALGQAAADFVRQGASMMALATVRGRIDLADADDAGVGVDLDDQRFLAAVAALVDVGQAQVDWLRRG